jgi:ribosomal protein S18 acetylase RimI-like enzyme
MSARENENHHMPTVRRATRNDIPALAATLTAAFADYPWTRWAIPPDDYARRLETLFTLDLTNVGLALDETWMTDDAASVAVWLPPKEQQKVEIDWARHGEATAPLIGERLDRLEAGDELIIPLRPQVPHWYLATLGTRPERQGEGLGRAALGPVLERCDAEGMPALTETVTPENVAFYRRSGFAVLHELEMPMDGPPMWILWREPR